MARFSVVVPTYNERENIRELVSRAEAAKPDIEIVFVDDNSPDNTSEEVERLAVEHKNIKLIERPGKMGLGSAVSEGIGKSTGDYVAVMDADLQHPPEKLAELYECLENGVDMAIASRYSTGGDTEGWGSSRKLVSRGAIALAHLLLPETRTIKDPVSGFFAFRRESMQDVRIRTRGYKILLEFLHESRYKGIKVVEIPFVFRARKRGASKLAASEMARYVQLLLGLARARLLT